MNRLDRGAISADVAERLRAGAVVARADTATIDLIGPGAVPSFQGLLTNDLEKPGDGGFVYGALLTPKGMVVVDGWAGRLGTRVRFTVPAEGRERATQLLQRSLPPRLARWSDRTGDHAVLRVAGAHALALAGAAGLPVPPAAGRTVEATLDDVVLEVARPSELAPFALQITLPAPDEAAIVARLARAGVLAAEPTALDLMRILGGWPALGAEVDDKTIPQEIRYDEIGGVSYTKGCYTGQETVSRLHFRGHPNRHLLGLLFELDAPLPPSTEAPGIGHEGRDVGRVTSVAWVPWLTRWIGLGMVRREVPLGAVVAAAGLEARVTALPFDLPSVGPA